MSDLRELYQEVILDHYKNPRNFFRPNHPSHKAEGYNPLCGDKITLYVNMTGDVVDGLAFEGSGCAISTASASLLTESIKGKTKKEVGILFDQFHGLVTGKTNQSSDLGKLAVFEGVREFPLRIKCATLGWHTLRAALENKQDPVSTE